MGTRSFIIRSATAATLVAGLAACGSDDAGSETEQPEETEASSPATDAEPTPPTGTGDEPTEREAEELVEGEPESEAEAAIGERGWLMRVVKRDGEDLNVTADLRPQRVNVEVADGTVVGVEFIG